MINTKTVAVEPKEDGVYVTFEGANAPKEPQRYDAVLVAAGRAPNGKLISAEKAGVTVTDRGFIEVDKQMRTNVPHIYAIGDIIGQPMLAHKAVHEATLPLKTVPATKPTSTHALFRALPTLLLKWHGLAKLSCLPKLPAVKLPKPTSHGLLPAVRLPTVATMVSLS